MSLKNKIITGSETLDGTYKIDSDKTIDTQKEALKKSFEKSLSEFTEKRLQNFNDMLASGTEHKVRIARAKEEYYRTGNLGGNYLSKENPGKTPEERRESLQLHPANNGEKLSTVKLDFAQLVVDSKIVSQPEWAKKMGYKEKSGFGQTYLLQQRKKDSNDENRYSKEKELS